MNFPVVYQPCITFVILLFNTGGQTITAESENSLLIHKYFFSLPFSYYKITDPASWINVDKNTGELRVANTIDRESKFVHDGIYNITVKAVDASKLVGNAVCFLFTYFCWPGSPHKT